MKNREMLARLGELAANDVPLLHVCGSIDPLLGKYSTVIEGIYQQFGGRISVMIKDGAAHHPHSLRDPKPIADFITQSVQPASGVPLGYLGGKVTTSSFYSIENSYRDFPREGTDITCRGAWFTFGRPAGCFVPQQSISASLRLLGVDSFIGDAAPAVIPHLRQGTVCSAQSATSPLLQAHRFLFKKRCTVEGSHKV